MRVHSGARVCCGISAVSILIGMTLTAAGIITVLVATFDGQRLEKEVWIYSTGIISLGFAIILLSLLGCWCAACYNSPSMGLVNM